MFDGLDKDGTGAIDYAELWKYLEADLDIYLTKHKKGLFIRILDPDRSGQITFEEFESRIKGTQGIRGDEEDTTVEQLVHCMRSEKPLLVLSVLLARPHGGDTAKALLEQMDKKKLKDLFNNAQKGLDNIVSMLEREKIRDDLMDPNGDDEEADGISHADRARMDTGIDNEVL